MRRRIANWLHVYNCGCVCPCNCSCSYSYSYSCRYRQQIQLLTHTLTHPLAHSQALQKINNNFVRYTRRSAYVNVTYLPACLRVCVSAGVDLRAWSAPKSILHFLFYTTAAAPWQTTPHLASPRTQARPPQPTPPPAGTFSFCYFYLLCFYLFRSFYLLWQRSCFFFPHSIGQTQRTDNTKTTTATCSMKCLHIIDTYYYMCIRM